MASVFNSKNTQLDLDTDVSFTGRWEDIQSYTSVINTLEVGTDTSGTVYFDWINMDDDDVPTTDTSALVSDSYVFSAGQVYTKQFDTRTRWFRLRVLGTGASLNQISTTYKKAPTEIKLSDDNTNIVGVNLGDTKNSMYTVLTDLSGAVLGSTNDAHTGEALYTHLADGSGAGLATTDNNRDITRTLTDVSFVFRSDGLGTGNNGSIIISNNRFRLPKSSISFKDGDTVRFAMGELDNTDFSVGAAFAGTPAPAGVLQVTGTVRYREVETDHVQFELLVDANTSEWFDPAVGFTNFDPSQFTDYDTMTSSDYTTAVAEGGGGYAYLHDNCGSDVPTVDTYYGAFADFSGFGATALTLNPGTYPLDLRFYQGSLINDGNFHQSSFDVSVAYDPLESLTVAVRDNNNLNIGSTQNTDTVDYYFRSNYIENPNILFMVDNCLGGGATPSENLQSIMTGIRQIVADICTNTGVAPTTAVIGYGNGMAYPIYSNYGSAPDHVRGSVLKNLSTSTTELEWNDDDYSFLTPLTTNYSNYWKALTDYVTSETPDTCIGSVYSNTRDAIVLFNYGDVSSSQAERDILYRYSDLFDSVTKLVVTDTDKDVTDLVSFTGTTDNIYRLSQTSTLEDSSLVQTLSKRLGAVPHVGSNALHVHTTDACGHSQAGTRPVTDAQHGDVALYYALADSCGTQIDTTMSTTATTGLNAAYVSLVTKVNAQGTDLNGAGTVNSDRPLHITFDTAFSEGKTFDFTVSGHVVTLDDLSNNNVNIKHLGIANETPAPIWLKVYDMSVGYYMENSGATLNATTGLLEASAATLQSRLVYNLAVPATDYRDFDFIKGVKFDYGVYMIASTNYRYDTYHFPPGNKHIFVHGSYFDTTAV